MAKRREPTSKGKNIITALLQEYGIKPAEDIQDVLKDLLGGTIQAMLEAEMNGHLGYISFERTDTTNYRNSKKSKIICSKYGEINIDIPQHRERSFEPKIVRKRQKDISGIEDKIIIHVRKRSYHQAYI